VRLSVVIPTWNDLPGLQRCLASLREQDLDAGQYQLVVVDDGSSDGTAAWLREQTDITAVVLPENRGRAAARNAGLEQVRGEQVVFLDADLTVPADFLRVHLEQAQPDLVWLGRVRFSAASGRGGFQRYLETRGAWKYREQGDLPARYFVTCNAMVPYALLQRTGGFNAELRYWGGEDMELGLRLAEQGVRFRFNSAALALHHQRRSFAGHVANQEIYGRHNLPRLLRRHPQLIRELQLEPLQPGGCQRWRRFWLRFGLAEVLVALLVAVEKPLRYIRLPDKFYDLALWLATVKGLRKGDRLWHG